MSKPYLRAVDPDRESNQDIARRRVREYEQSKQPKEPTTNIHGPEEGRAPSLNVDEILRKSQPDHLGKKV